MKFSTLFSPALTWTALFCIVLVTSVSALHPTAFAADKTPATILVLGDSLSGAWGIDSDQGWVALLQKKIETEGYDYRLVNASVSGDTTRTGLSRIDAALLAHQPTIVIVALGGNDGLRGLAFSEIETSLASIIEHCIKNNARVLLAGLRLPPNYGPVYNQQFAAIYTRLAKRFGIPLIPRMLERVSDHRELMQEDGMHPKAEAQPRVMENVWLELEKMLEKL